MNLNIESLPKKFFNTIFFSVMLLLSKPLSAQIDNGYFECNNEFASKAAGLDMSSGDSAMLKRNYNSILQDWNKCAQKYTAPNIVSLGINNDTIKLSDFYNKVIVLHFWTSSCVPCIEEMPTFDHLYQSYEDTNVVFISLATDNASRLKKYFKSSMRLIPSASEIFNLYGVVGYPLTIIIRKNKMIKYQFLGYEANKSHENEGLMREKIDEALME